MDLSFMEYFDEETMSVHIKEDLPIMAKRGRPGSVKVENIGSPMDLFVVEQFENEIREAVFEDRRSFIEIEYEGAEVIQLRDLRITITKPPVSEAMEITIVKPVKRLHIDDYHLPREIKERILNQAQGVLIAGAPGAGKSTFAQAVADMYFDYGYIVKTMENPRDMQVDKGVTQYSKIEGEMEKTADILLLVRPDYTIYDEVRKTDDFEIFADMRLAGVGMLGVVHATKPIDAIQRAVSRMELGIIPSVIDTVVFIDRGEVGQIFELEMKVKVPHGMIEADLARPVVTVSNFLTGEQEYEIYTYGEQTMVIKVEELPVPEIEKKFGPPKPSGVMKAAMDEVIRDVRRNGQTDEVYVDMVEEGRVAVYIPKKTIPKVVGRKGKKINKLEKMTGLKIDIEPLQFS